MMTIILVGLIILLCAASAYCSCSEVAFFSLPASRIKTFKHHNQPQKRIIAKLLSQSKSLLVTIFMANTIVNVLIQNITSDLYDQYNASWILKVGVPLVLILVFGELLPKYYGLLYNEKIATKTATYLDFVHTAFTPIRTVLTYLASLFSKYFFFFLKPEDPLSKEEVEHILQSSAVQGIVGKDEAALILGLLSMEDRYIKELMLPRGEMPMYSIQDPLSKLYFLFSENKQCELAVYDQSEDTILGIITAKKILLSENTISTPQDIIPLLEKPFFLPQSTTVKTLIHNLNMSSSKIAIIVDEYGAIEGMISYQILATVLAQNLQGKEKKDHEYTRIATSAIIANGTMTLQEVRSLFKKKLPSKHHSVTLGGWLTEQLGTIPIAGATYHYNTLFFRVLSSEATHIKKILIQNLKPTEENQEINEDYGI